MQRASQINGCGWCTDVHTGAGTVAVATMTKGRGFSSAKAMRQLDWQLRYPSWRQGFKDEPA